MKAKRTRYQQGSIRKVPRAIGFAWEVRFSAWKSGKRHQRTLGHIPLIDVHPRRDQNLKAELQAEAKRQKLLTFNYSEDVRYRERTTVERVNARKDEFGGRAGFLPLTQRIPTGYQSKCRTRKNPHFHL